MDFFLQEIFEILTIVTLLYCILPYIIMFIINSDDDDGIFISLDQIRYLLFYYFTFYYPIFLFIDFIIYIKSKGII